MPGTILHYGSRGEAVKKLQRLLNTNPYTAQRRPVSVDGQFGSLTGAACQQAKYWLGYERDDMTPVAAQPLRSYLAKTRPLTPEMRARRKVRLEKRAARPPEPMSERALAAAKADLGIVEGPMNHVKYNEWWCGGHSDGAPYCVRAVSYWYEKAGSRTIDREAGRYQGTDYLLSNAMHGRGGVHLTHDPDPGDAFVIDFDGRSDPDHAGLFVNWANASLVNTIEANATMSNGQQGVGRHRRAAAQCWFIVFE